MSKVIKGVNDLATQLPKIISEWDHERNIGLSPDEISAHSNKKVWWKCALGHSWEASPDHRSRSQNCPYCSGKRVMKGFNDLKSQSPEMTLDWDYQKNTEFSPEEITMGSNKKVWWKCHICGYEWRVSPNSRCYGNSGIKKCPICVKKDRITNFRKTYLKEGENDLASQAPHLLSEWDQKLNGDLDPKTFTINSKEKVWWKCNNCGYEWKATIQNRCLRNSGCPKCAGKVVVEGENDLATLFPHLAKEWDYEKNGDLKPSMFLKGSNKDIWWVCARGHKWKAKIESRTYGQSCPECSKNLRTSFPEQSIIYYLSFKFKVENRMKIAGWEADVFLSEYNIAIEYDGVLYHSDDNAADREKRKENAFSEAGIDLIRIKETTNIKEDTNNIIYLVPRSDYKTLDDALIRLFKLIELRLSVSIDIVPDILSDKINILSNYDQYQKENNIVSIDPNVLKEWDYEKNKDLKPEVFTKYSMTRVWWKCEKGHSYQHTIGNKVMGKLSCPYCSNSKTMYGFNDLATTDPLVVKEWDREKNTDISPENINRSSSKKVWWKCSKGHSWEARINSRVKGVGCPYCNNDRVLKGYNDLLSQRPLIAQEWDYDKNGDLFPDEVIIGTPKKVWWKCKEGHSWIATIQSRACRNTGCPYCKHQKFKTGYNDLKTMYPKLAEEWNYEKNGDLKPENVLAGGTKKVYWKCAKGHEWDAAISGRINGRGCPYCSNKKLLTGYNDFATVYPELMSEWDYEKNGDLRPENISCGSNTKIWWKCKNGHSWCVSPNQRKRPDGKMSQCRLCKNH